MRVICFYDTINLFYCIPLVYENKTSIYIYIYIYIYINKTTSESFISWVWPMPSRLMYKVLAWRSEFAKSSLS